MRSGHSKNQSRRAVASRLQGAVRAIALMGGLLLIALWPFAAQAQFATGGSGAFRNDILWIDWSQLGAPSIPNGGGNVVVNRTVAGLPLVVTCNIANIVNVAGGAADPQLNAYIPGTFSADSLDDLYNIGGTGASNTMQIGLANRVAGNTVGFDVSCSATLNGANYPLPGLVVSNAEVLAVVQGEYHQLTFSNAGGAAMRAIERIRAPGCDIPYTVQRTDNGNGTDSYRVATTPSPTTPAQNFCAGTSLDFVQGATALQVEMKGGGTSAIALGVMIDVGDYGDAPAPYGEAVHSAPKNWAGGGYVAGAPAVDIFDPGFTLATPTPVGPLLGAGVSVDSAAFPNVAGASADTFDDSLGAVPVFGLVGSVYTLTPSCTNGATVAAWIDFDRNGVFDPGERVAGVCAGGTVTLNWIVLAGLPAGATQYYLRLRTATNPAEVANPTGFAFIGEVEDYAFFSPLLPSPPSSPVSVPTLGEYGLAMLSLLMVLGYAGTQRRKAVRR